jgi:hypothetical protein
VVIPWRSSLPEGRGRTDGAGGLSGRPAPGAIARALPGAKSAPSPGFIAPALATLRSTVPTAANFVHELKLDGYRIQAHVLEGGATLYTRSGLDWTNRFATIAADARRLPANALILDGEIISADPDGRPDFSALQDDLKQGRHDRLVLHYWAAFPRRGSILRAVATWWVREDLMRRIAFPLIVAAVVIGCGDASRTEVSYTVVTEATHDCGKAPNASIDTSDATFNLTSTCERILVKGGNNKVTIEAAKRIDVDGGKNVIDVGAADIIRVNGVGNKIKFKNKGVTKKTPEVVAIGDNNSLFRSD